jgi:hypothetical protein
LAAAAGATATAVVLTDAVFIHFAVAVVVDFVAGLIGGTAGDAFDLVTVLTGVDGPLARAHAAGLGSRVNGLIDAAFCLLVASVRRTGIVVVTIPRRTTASTFRGAGVVDGTDIAVVTGLTRQRRIGTGPRAEVAEVLRTGIVVEAIDTGIALAIFHIEIASAARRETLIRGTRPVVIADFRCTRDTLAVVAMISDAAPVAVGAAVVVIVKIHASRFRITRIVGARIAVIAVNG